MRSGTLFVKKKGDFFEKSLPMRAPKSLKKETFLQKKSPFLKKSPYAIKAIDVNSFLT